MPYHNHSLLPLLRHVRSPGHSSRVFGVASCALFLLLALGGLVYPEHAYAQEYSEYGQTVQIDEACAEADSEPAFCMAEKGDPDASYIIGRRMLTPPLADEEEAHDWFLKAARQGHARSQFEVGFDYATGRGVATDYREALTWYTRAAKQGHASAAHNLGVMYMDGQGVPQDLTRAVEYLEKAIELSDHPDSHAILGGLYAGLAEGTLYSDADDFQTDISRAHKHWHLAAENGHAGTQFVLGREYMKGGDRLEVERDPARAVQWMQQAAEQGESNALRSLMQWAEEEEIPEAQYQMGLNYRDGVRPDHAAPFSGVPTLSPDPDKAIEWLETAAENGVPDATFQLARIYLAGDIVERDHDRGMRLYLEAAEKGSIDAQLKVGELYRRGRGSLERNTNKAVHWYRLAADRGDSVAHMELAKISLRWPYTREEAGMTDEEEAVGWLMRAAERGDMEAQANLAAYYLEGRWVERDTLKAGQWLRKAAEAAEKDNRADISRKAMFSLGEVYRTHEELKDYEEAVKWYRKADREASWRAEIQLAAMMAHGQGVAPDPARGARMLREMIESKYDPLERGLALIELGRLYEEGLGVRPDSVLAYALYDIAAESRSDDIHLETEDQKIRARKLRDALEEHMSPQKIEEARKTARTGEVVKLISQ